MHLKHLQFNHPRARTHIRIHVHVELTHANDIYANEPIRSICKDVKNTIERHRFVYFNSIHLESINLFDRHIMDGIDRRISFTHTYELLAKLDLIVACVCGACVRVGIYRQSAKPIFHSCQSLLLLCFLFVFLLFLHSLRSWDFWSSSARRRTCSYWASQPANMLGNEPVITE